MPTLPNVVVRPDGLWVITLLAALHSAAGAFHSLAAAWISIWRAVAPPSRTYMCDLRMPRLPPVEKSPQTRLRATLWPGVGYSQVTFDQSASSSSATSWQRPGQGALAHLGTGDPDHDRVIGTDHHPGGDFRRAVLREDRLRTAERDVEAEGEPAAGGGRGHHEGAAIDLRCIIHGCLPYALAAA